MTNMNGDFYVEIKNPKLVQLLEGLYKTMHPGAKMDLWQILEFYFLQNSVISILLDKRDLKLAGD